MFGVFVICKIKPGMGEAFVAAAQRDRDGSRTEAGNIRFDVLRATATTEPGEPEVFYLFEMYRSAEAFTEHQRTPHYILFRDETAPMMAESRQGLRYVPIHADPWE